MTLDTARLLALLTWPPCVAVLFIASCRLNAMPKNTRWPVVLEYAVWSAIAVTIPLLPLTGDWPGVGDVCVAWGLLVIMLCNKRAWAGDVAPDIATDVAPLEGVPNELR